MSPARVLTTRGGLAASVLVLTLVAGLPHAAATPASILAIAVDRAVVEKVEDGIGDEALLAAIAAVITSKLGLPLPSPLHAHFYESAETFESGLIRDARSSPAMAREHARFAIGVGSARGIFLRRDRLTITSFLGRVGLYAHELAHVAQATLADGRRIASEQWLREGHADWVKYQALEQLGLQTYERSRARGIRSVRLGAVSTLPSLLKLSSSLEWADTRNRLSGRETYAQAFLAADWLVERSGTDALRGYFRGKPSRDRLEAFQTSFGISLEQFAEEFATYLAALVRRPQ